MQILRHLMAVSYRFRFLLFFFFIYQKFLQSLNVKLLALYSTQLEYLLHLLFASFQLLLVYALVHECQFATFWKEIKDDDDNNGMAKCFSSYSSFSLRSFHFQQEVEMVMNGIDLLPHYLFVISSPVFIKD